MKKFLLCLLVVVLACTLVLVAACDETEMKSISAEYLLIIPILAVLSAAILLFFRRAKSDRKNGRQRKQ